MRLVRVADDHRLLPVNYLGRRVAPWTNRLCLVKFKLLAVIDIGTEAPLDGI